MGISGTVKARCEKCKCIFVHHINDWIFTDEEVIGTCDNCFDKKSHDCIDDDKNSLIYTVDWLKCFFNITDEDSK